MMPTSKHQPSDAEQAAPPYEPAPARTCRTDDDSARRCRSATRVVKTLRPAQPGTIKLCHRYGEALVCVRYRQDEAGLRRYTTVELVVDEAPVTGPRIAQRIFAVRIGRLETDLQATAKAHGARWDHESKLWLMKGAAVRRLGLERRVRARKR